MLYDEVAEREGGAEGENTARSSSSESYWLERGQRVGSVKDAKCCARDDGTNMVHSLSFRDQREGALLISSLDPADFPPSKL